MIQIDISDGPGNGSLRVPLRELRERLVELDPGKPYRIVGGSDSQRALAAFIFAQRGISVGTAAGAAPALAGQD
jgi:hypothetical protein